MATELDVLDVLDAGQRLPPLERALLLARAAGAPDPDGLRLGARNSAILDLRSRLLGAALEATAACPSCHEISSFTLDATDLSAAGSSEGGQLTFERDGISLVCRPPTTADLRAAASAATAAAARAELIASCVVSATDRGGPVPASALPPRVVEDIARRLSEADPLADVQLEVTCAACGAAWSAALDIADFAWRELRQWSRRILWEVHTLARAYGWREADVLAVPPARRQAYLEWVTNG